MYKSRRNPKNTDGFFLVLKFSGSPSETKIRSCWSKMRTIRPTKMTKKKLSRERKKEKEMDGSRDKDRRPSRPG